MVRPALLALLTFGVVTAKKNYKDFVTRNFNTIQSLYNLTVFPNNVPFFEHGADAFPDGLFSERIRGRVTPLGDFQSKVDSVEYFVALSPVPQPPPLAPLAFTEAKIVSFVSGCPEAATSTVVFRTELVDLENPGEPTTPVTFLKQVAFWRFDDVGEVTHFDAYIPLLTEFVEITAFGQIGALAAPQSQQAFVQRTCSMVMENCQGANAQFPTFEECANFMSTTPFGSLDYLASNTVACRNIHAILTKSRPDVHCPHTGPTGGGKCVDVDFGGLFFDDAKIFGTAEPFKCLPSGKGNFIGK